MAANLKPGLTPRAPRGAGAGAGAGCGDGASREARGCKLLLQPENASRRGPGKRAAQSEVPTPVWHPASLVFRAWLTPGLEPCGRPLGKGAGLGCFKGCCLPGGCGTWGAVTPRIWLCEAFRARRRSPLWLPRKETRAPPVCRLYRPVKITATY